MKQYLTAIDLFMMRRIFKLTALFTLFFGLALQVSATNHQNKNDDDYKKKLIEHFDKKGVDLEPYFNDKRFELLPRIKTKFTKSAEKKLNTLDDYKKVIGYAGKKRKIPEFVAKYKSVLLKAEKEYGIPQEVIVGILAVESDFGVHKGRHNPFNAYVSMIAEDYRSDFALAQLEELMEWSERNKVDVLSLKSSYAGAMSYAQFIPYSLNKWFVGTELYDMENNIYSVANYLKHFKGVTGSVEKAVFRYNPSTLYQQAVLALADDAKDVIIK